MAARRFSLGVIQLRVGVDKAKNIQRAGDLIKEAASKGCKLVVLPECFNSPYGTKHFPEFAESIPDGDTSKALADAAQKNKVRDENNLV